MPEEPLSSLGASLLRTRKRLGYTREQVSRLTKALFLDPESHVSAAYLRKLESSRPGDEIRPSEQRLKALSSVFGIYPEGLLLERARTIPSDTYARLLHYPALRPTFDMQVAHSLFIKAKASRAVLQTRLPRHVTLSTRGSDEVQVRLLIQQRREALAGQHGEWLMLIPVKFQGDPFLFVAECFVDSVPMLCALREGFGYPAKLGHPRVTMDAPASIEGMPQLQPELTLNGFPLVTMRVDHASSRKSGSPSVSPDFGPYLTHKCIASPGGVDLDVSALVSCHPIEHTGGWRRRDFKGLRVGIEFLSDAFRINWGLQDQETVGFYRCDFGISYPPAHVEYDYLRELRNS